MKSDTLKAVRDWAQEKLDAGCEPPFAWYRYMQLREALDAILDGFATRIPQDYLATPPKGNLIRVK